MNTEIDELIEEVVIIISENKLDKSVLVQTDPENKFGLFEYYDERAIVLEKISAKLAILASLEK